MVNMKVVYRMGVLSTELKVRPSHPLEYLYVLMFWPSIPTIPFRVVVKEKSPSREILGSRPETPHTSA